MPLDYMPEGILITESLVFVSVQCPVSIPEAAKLNRTHLARVSQLIGLQIKAVKNVNTAPRTNLLIRDKKSVHSGPLSSHKVDPPQSRSSHKLSRSVLLLSTAGFPKETKAHFANVLGEKLLLLEPKHCTSNPSKATATIGNLKIGANKSMIINQ